MVTVYGDGMVKDVLRDCHTDCPADCHKDNRKSGIYYNKKKVIQNRSEKLLMPNRTECGTIPMSDPFQKDIFWTNGVTVPGLSHGLSQDKRFFKNIAFQNCVCYNASRQKVMISPSGQRTKPPTVLQHSRGLLLFFLRWQSTHQAICCPYDRRLTI